jgi:hypothetical protein
MINKKDPFGYEQLNRYGSYKWLKYVLKVNHIYVDGFDKIKWFYVVATSVNHAIDIFKDQYAKGVDWINGEAMIIMGVYDKQETAYLGDYKGNKLPPLK